MTTNWDMEHELLFRVQDLERRVVELSARMERVGALLSAVDEPLPSPSGDQEAEEAFKATLRAPVGTLENITIEGRATLVDDEGVVGPYSIRNKYREPVTS